MPPRFPEADLDPATLGMLRAAYGMPSIGAPSTLASAATGASSAGSPVDAWLAAAVSRAVGALAAADGHAAPHAGANAAAAAATGGNDALRSVGLAATSSAASAMTSADSAALTPLEQAVRDLITRFADPGPSHGPPSRHAIDDAGAALAPFAGFVGQPFGAMHDAPTTRAAGHAAPASPVQLPEPSANPSHVHLVIDDGPERVVATVAVRGNEVHVALRSSDDATATALARNAASLDHAMRSRGLDLQDLTAEREPRDRRPSQDAEPRERRPRDAERFQLEEKP